MNLESFVSYGSVKIAITVKYIFSDTILNIYMIHNFRLLEISYKYLNAF